MSRGYGRVQRGCLEAIAEYEHAGHLPPTTGGVAAAVYHVAPDKDGFYDITDAQYVAVKRALEGLQRQGKVIGFERVYGRNDAAHDGRIERGYCWMSERRAQRWVRQQGKHPMAEAFKGRMRAIGMQPK